MKNIILIMIFVLLIIGAFFIIGINPFRRKSYISLAKQVQEEKFRNVDAVNIAEDADEVSYPPSWMFLIQNKRQMALIRPKAEFSFVMIENGTPIFYE